jgi:hypothetical protein
VVDAAPLVNVNTMVYYIGRWGVMLQTYRDNPLPDCPTPNVTVPSDLGAKCFYPDPGNGTSWVQLLVLNRQTLAFVSNTDLACPQATTTPQEKAFDMVPGSGTACTKALSNFIAGLNAGDLVIAVNQPGDEANKGVQPPVGVGAVLGSVGSNHGIGITPTWYNAPDHGAHLPNAVRGTVSAIGVPGWPSGGVSLESANPDSWYSGDLSADIAVNNLAYYSPLTAATFDEEIDSPITKVLTQPPTPWPASSPGEAAAFSYLGTMVKLGSNPRAQYYTSTKTAADWKALVPIIKSKIYGEIPPEDRSTFTRHDFLDAQTEMATEVDDVADVVGYTASLAAPFDGASKTLWADFGAVTDAVNTNTANGKGAEVAGLVEEVISAGLELLPVFGHVAHTVGAAVLAAYKLGLAATEYAGRPADSEFSTEAAQLGSELAHRLDGTETEISQRWSDIIVADWGKLNAVAQCVTPDNEKNCPDPSDGWQITKNSTTHTQTLLQLSLQRELYSTLVPAKYPYAMALGLVGLDSHKNAGDWCKSGPPFTKDTGLYAWPGDFQKGYGEAIVLQTNNASFATKWPAASMVVFNRMFGKVIDSGNYLDGGLGINEEAFFKQNYGIDKGISVKTITNPHFYDKGYFVFLTLCSF